MLLTATWCGAAPGAETQSTPACEGAPITVRAGTAFRDCPDSPELLVLKPGRLLMGEDSGSPYEIPVHEVNVAAFAIGKYEVTFDEWDACQVAGACARRADDRGWGRGRRPVINVSWTDAQQYVQWLSRRSGRRYRLPSEAEWEYAARAGSQTRYSWGDGSEWVCDSANVLDLRGASANPQWRWHVFCDDGFPYTAPVGSFKANPWGLYDMAGNVWEWVEDCWHNSYAEAPTQALAWNAGGGGDCSKHVNRGGGWGNHPRSMRAAARDADDGNATSDGLGFRVVRDLP
nr:formylglycine-generating enzyme family protein [Solimonas aquatica]